MQIRPVCVFDSGSGGLSIFREIRRELPREPVIYVGDHKMLPYGAKSRTWIVQRVLRILQSVSGFNPKLIVIACNTATTAGIDRYRAVLGNLPVIGVVPVVKTAAAVTRTGHIGIFTTRFTAESAYQKTLISRYASGLRVTTVSSNRLVELVENPEIPGAVISEELKIALAPVVGSDCDTVALGCTHFPFVRDRILAVIRHPVNLLDSGGAVARHVARVLSLTGQLNNGLGKKTYFYTTGNVAAVSRSATCLLGQPVVFEKLNVK